MKYFLVALCTILVSEPINAQDYQEKLVIGADPDKPIEYSFGKIVDFQIGPNGLLYIADQLSNTIKVFDEHGKFIKEIGQRGRGPGEFILLQNIFFNSSGNLMATDPMQFRVIEFDDNGEVLNTYKTPKESQALNFFKYIFSIDDKFITVYKQWGFGKWARFDKDEIIHIWDSKFSQIENSYGSFNAFNYNNSFAEVYVRSKLGSVELIDKKTIIVAPHIYTGNLHFYKKLGDSWIEHDKIATKEYDVAYFISKDSDNNSMDLISVSSSGKGKVYGIVNVLSAGIFSYKSGIIYFTLVKQENGAIYNLEAQVFDSKFNLVKNFTVKTFSGDQKPNLNRTLVIENDKEGNFYMAYKNTSIGDVIEKFSLKE